MIQLKPQLTTAFYFQDALRLNPLSWPKMPPALGITTMSAPSLALMLILFAIWKENKHQSKPFYFLK